MNEEQRKPIDREKTTGGKEASTKLPLFRILLGGKTQQSAINHRSVLTRMIFTTMFVCTHLLLNSFANGASVELGSKNSAIKSHFNSIRSSSSVHNSDIVNNHTPSESSIHNVSPGSHSSREGRRLQSRQVSTNEWIFSSLAQPPEQTSSSSSQQQIRSRSRPGNADLTYRSLPMVSYQNYYRNPNIYSQIPRKVDGDDKKLQNAHSYRGITSLNPMESSASISGRYDSGNNDEESNGGLGRRRASSSLSVMNELSGINSATVSSKLPEVLRERESGTTGVSRTAPATDPSILGTERPTSTQEMQIPNDEASTVVDDIQIGSRAEIGRGQAGRKRGRDMSDATVTFHFENNAPIVFPGTAPTASSRGTMRPYGTPSETAERVEMGTFDPFQAKVLDGWKRLHELRKKSQSFEGKKSSISRDQLADAKIISMLTISGIPKCASKDGYCEHIDSYPRSFFDQILNKTLSPDIFNGIFGETTDNNSVLTDVEFKLRHDFEDTPLCSVREHTIYPKAAQNRKGKFMYIVNHDEYLQGIRVETCTRENDACMFTEGHLPGYSSTCKQKFIYKKLLAFTPEGKAMPDTFRLPSCCVCHVRSMFISDRINPGAEVGSADLQPTLAADEGSWNPSFTTLTYPHHDEASPPSSFPFSSSTEADIGITFPTTSKSDLPSYQVPTPTTSTSSSQLPVHHQTGGQPQNSRAENQTASRRLH